MTCICTQELNVFRGKCGMLFHYDWISVPLVYTQVTLPCLRLNLASKALWCWSQRETEGQLRPHINDVPSQSWSLQGLLRPGEL